MTSFAWVAGVCLVVFGQPSGTAGDVVVVALVLVGAASAYALWPWRPGPRAELPVRPRYGRSRRPPLRQIRNAVLLVLAAALVGVAAVGLSVVLESSGWETEDVYERPTAR